MDDYKSFGKLIFSDDVKRKEWEDLDPKVKKRCLLNLEENSKRMGLELTVETLCHAVVDMQERLERLEATIRIQPPPNQDEYVGIEATPEAAVSYIGSHIFLKGDGTEMTVKEYIESDDGLDDREYRETFIAMFPYDIQPLALFATLKIRKHHNNL